MSTLVPNYDVKGLSKIQVLAVFKNQCLYTQAGQHQSRGMSDPKLCSQTLRRTSIMICQLEGVCLAQLKSGVPDIPH